MMYWSDCAMANGLAQFFVDIDPYGAGDAGICDENDCTIPSEEFIFEVTYLAEFDPVQLIEWIEDLADRIEDDNEACKTMAYYLDWLNTMVEQMEEN